MLEVSVVYADLGRAPAGLAHALAPDERERAARFARDEERRLFVARRGLVRAIVGRALGVAPATVPLGRGEHGSPLVPGLALSVSSSHDLLAVALARATLPLGVDVERLDLPRDAEAIARTALGPEELEALGRIPAADRAAAVLRAWTRKEAVLKARGSGLRESLAAVTVSLGPGPPALLALAGDRAERWTLVDLAPPRAVGTVAIAAAARVVERHFEG